MRVCGYFRWVSIVLFLSISSYVFSQKVQIKIEGNGAVFVQNKSFRGEGIYEFEVERGLDTLHFCIKLGEQFYLDSLLDFSLGVAMPISRNNIYAERDDNLHYYKCSLPDINVFHFVFREVQPLHVLPYPPYGSQDKRYSLIYTPEEFIYACTQLKASEIASPGSDTITISLQNDIDLNGEEIRTIGQSSPFQVLLGNNKTIKKCYGKNTVRLFNQAIAVLDLHMLDGGFWFDNPNLFLEGCTANPIIGESGYWAIFGTWIAGSHQRPLQDCINFGDCNYDADVVFNSDNTAKNLINWGSGYIESFPSLIDGTVIYGKISGFSNVFNFGRCRVITRMLSSDTIVSPIFNDRNLAPETKMPTRGENIYNLESRQLIDATFMRSLMGDSAEQDFIFEDGFYPRLRHMDERPGRLAASPILLYPGENADSVTLPFYVDTNYGVRWISTNEDVIRIEGNVGYVRHPVPKDTTVRIEAWKEDFNKHVYLTVPASNYVYQELKEDTICPGDSVKMINTYARNEGWNYEVVETPTAEYDTIYRMYLHHYPTYHEVVHRDAVEHDSLPYIYGEDTIRNFGLTELRRYQTVHGCDSVTYVWLDTLYIHRERHFYDMMHACQGDTLHWRGGEITQSGDYTDTVFDPYRGGTDSIYHLRADIYPVYHLTYTDSCYIEELPYVIGGVPISDFGSYINRYTTAAGCDSVYEYVLSRRWHHYRVQVEVRGEGVVNVTDTVLREDGSLWLAFTAGPCHVLDSLKIDGHAVSPRNLYELKDLHGDCTVEAVFTERAPAESVLRYEVCGDSLPVIHNGEAYGEGVHEIWLRSAQGCDSVVRLYVQGKENAARLTVVDTIAPPCGAEEIAFAYGIETGAPKHLRLAFDPAALSAGFRDTVLTVSSTGTQTVRLPLPSSARPDRYGLRLWQADGTGCYVAEDALTFAIPYPSSIIVQKWNDVLAVLATEYNGGYTFSGYQWYRNGEAIEGETGPYHYAKPYLRSSDTYAVLLERASDGLRLMSCGVKRKGYPKEISLELRPNPTAQGGEVQVSVNGRPEAEGVIEVFDGTGKPIYERTFRAVHTLRATWQPGTYVVRVRDGRGSWMATGKLTVL